MKTGYYTWKGLDKCYESQEEAQKALNAKGEKNAWAVGFEHKEEAEAFRSKELEQYIRDKHKPIDAAQYDAVIYADGSWGNQKLAAYGLIIFFKDETEPYIESGTLEDVDAAEYTVTRYDASGNETKESRKNEGIPEAGDQETGKGFASSSNQVAGEIFGVMRALEICCKQRKLKKLAVIYDCEVIEKGYHNRNNIEGADGDAPRAYRKCWKKLKDVDPHFIKVDSHSGSGQYPIDAEVYLHSVYNDLVDILAKVESGVKFKHQLQENFNLFRIISDEFERFSTAGADTTEKRRKHARKYVNDVLNKSNGIYRPRFSKE